MHRVIVLGAGASFGSEPTVRTPPLGNGPSGLFARLEEHDPFFRGLPEELRASFRVDFEGGMKRFFDWSNADTAEFQRKLAWHLAEYQPTPQSAYVTLLRLIDVERVVFASLNYDLLLEQSAALLGMDCTYSTQSTSRLVKVLKVHGSSNFWPDVPVGMFKNVRMSGNGLADIVAPIRPLNRVDTVARCRLDDSLAPAIAMYTEGKSSRVSPDYVKHQQLQFHEAVMGARRVLVAGVRVHPADTHIWEPLAKTRAPVYYFGLNADRSSFESWSADCQKAKAFFIEAGFREAVGQIARHAA